ncbi:MAG: putative proline dehydrogenase [Gemmatimonadetes bacterium]|nr:putative proline dehydrogenase [Gemmatimonadota bacterium]
MLRRGLLWLSEHQGIFNFVRRNGLARRFAARFVAGETIESAAAVAEALASQGTTATLDVLGESVHEAAAAEAACGQYLALLDRMARSPGVQVNVSIKLTQMGFDLDEELCYGNMVRILDRASALDGFVRLDMESSHYTQRTLDFFEHRLFPGYGARVGVVIQSALRRSTADVERLVRLKARVRLCKGAYLEPPDVAFPDKADVDRHYVALMERLLREGNYPGIATHDERIIATARKVVAREGIAPDRFEFQMLYGVRRDLQEELRAAGHRLRVYIPFGTQWYPYLMRRLAERPANIAFILGNVVREGLSRR